MSEFRGIVLAGGLGTRLYPMTLAVSKQLLPVYDKPLVYYPIATLMLAGIREILLISAPSQTGIFRNLLGTGTELGLRFEYAIQPTPRGVAESLVLAEPFLDGRPSALALGDNILYGDGLHTILMAAAQQTDGATIFAHPVRNPECYGVVEFDDQGVVKSLVEKPTEPQSHYATPGLYFYDSEAPAIAGRLRPSLRGELEITDLNRFYLEQGRLRVEILGRGCTWMDAGTPDSLLQAANYLQAVEQRQGLKIACLEEIAYRKRFIDEQQFDRLAERYPGDYGDYLRRIRATI